LYGVVNADNRDIVHYMHNRDKLALAKCNYVCSRSSDSICGCDAILLARWPCVHNASHYCLSSVELCARSYLWRFNTVTYCGRFWCSVHVSVCASASPCGRRPHAQQVWCHTSWRRETGNSDTRCKFYYVRRTLFCIYFVDAVINKCSVALLVRDRETVR